MIQFRKTKVAWLLVALVLMFYNLYGWIGVANNLWFFTGVRDLIIVFLIFYGFQEISRTKEKILVWLLLSTFISMFVVLFYWEQPIFKTFNTYTSYLLPFLFFALCKIKARTEDVEKGLTICALLYFVCWLIALYCLPNLIFGADRDDDLMNVDRGFFRFFIPTKEHWPFMVFFFMSLYFNTKKRIWAFLAIGAYIVIILHVGRQMMAWTFVGTVLYILYQYRRRWKLIVVSAAFLYFIGAAIINNIETVSILFDMTTEQTENVEDDIRYQAIEYFATDYHRNIFTCLFGEGLPCEGSKLYSLTKNNEGSLGFFKSDVGFFGLYADMGLFGIIVYLLLFRRILKMKVESRYVYLKFYFIYIYGSFLLAHSLTTNILFNMCAFYMLWTSEQRLKGNACNS